MKKYLFALSSVVLMGWAACRCSFAQQDNAAEQLLRKLQSEDRKERLQTKEEIAAWRSKIIAGLITIVRDGPEFEDSDAPDRDTKKIAIQLLGEFRAEEAVDALIDNMLYAQLNSVSVSRFIKEIPLASLALIRIGPKALQTILQRLREREITDILASKPRWLALHGETDNLARYVGQIIQEIMVNSGGNAGGLLKNEIDKEAEKGQTVYLRNLRIIAGGWRRELDEYYWREADCLDMKSFRKFEYGPLSIRTWLQPVDNMLSRQWTDRDRKDPLFNRVLVEPVRAISQITGEEYIPDLFDDAKMQQHEFTKEELQAIVDKAKRWWSDFEKSPEMLNARYIKELDERSKYYFQDTCDAVKNEVVKVLRKISEIMGQEIVEGVFDDAKMEKHEFTKDEIKDLLEKTRKWYEEHGSRKQDK